MSKEGNGLQVYGCSTVSLGDHLPLVVLFPPHPDYDGLASVGFGACVMGDPHRQLVALCSLHADGVDDRGRRIYKGLVNFGTTEGKAALEKGNPCMLACEIEFRGDAGQGMWEITSEKFSLMYTFGIVSDESLPATAGIRYASEDYVDGVMAEDKAGAVEAARVAMEAKNVAIENAGLSTNEANKSIVSASDAKKDASDAKKDASAAKISEANAAISASSSAESAKTAGEKALKSTESAERANTSAAEALQSKNTSTEKANESVQSATSSANSASLAVTKAAEAEAASSSACTSMNDANEAREFAVLAQEAAEKARDEATDGVMPMSETTMGGAYLGEGLMMNERNALCVVPTEQKGKVCFELEGASSIRLPGEDDSIDKDEVEVYVYHYDPGAFDYYCQMDVSAINISKLMSGERKYVKLVLYFAFGEPTTGDRIYSFSIISENQCLAVGGFTEINVSSTGRNGFTRREFRVSCSDGGSVFIDDMDSEMERTPVGSLMYYAGQFAPDGWLICNGLVLRRVDYPRLYQAIGDTYYPTGGIEIDETLFAIPDLRGLFLRGLGGLSSAAGVKQGDAIREIYGNSTATSDASLSPPDGVFYRSGGQYRVITGTNRMDYVSAFSASRVVPTATENRPANMAFNILIKCR